MRNALLVVKTLSPLQISILIVLLPLGFLIWKLETSFLVPLVAAPVVLGGYHYRHRLSANWRMVYAVTVLVISVVLGLTMVRIMRVNVWYPPEFDFKSFWLNGRIGVQGLNFYDPNNYHEQAAPLNPGEAFTEELLNSAFWYPPPSILLFLPLGWFADVSNAMLAWNLILCAFLALSVWLTWKTFFADSGAMGLLVSTATVFLLHAVWATFFYGQSSIILLALWLLIWRDRDLPRAGVWLALSILVKPFMAVFVMYLVLQRHWRGLLSCAAVLVAACLLTVALFGVDIFLTYQPAARLPDILYVEWVNQGLLAIILRRTGYDYSNQSPIMHPLFLAGALVLTAITAWVVYRLPKKDNRWALGLTLLLGLLVYPASLMHYSILLLIPMLLVWTSEDFIGGVRGRLVFITLIYVLTTYNLGEKSFHAFALCWGVFAVIGFRKLFTRSLQPGAQPVQTAVNSSQV